MSRIHYCTVVFNRWDTFRGLAASFTRLKPVTGAESDRLVVYDWNGSGKDIYSQFGRDIVFNAGNEQGHINRAAGRMRAMAAANPFLDDLVFFVDCDMVLPPDFSERVRQHVKPGHAYFPICYSLYRDAPMVVTSDGQQYLRVPGSDANGWWRENGRGNCGFVLADLMRIGGWDGARWGTRYGREDDDVFWRATQKLAVVRERVPDFFHQWHPQTKEARNPSTGRKKQ